MSIDDPITDIQVQDPLKMFRQGDSVSLTVDRLEPEFVKLTAQVDGVVDADGNTRTAYRARRQQPIGGGQFADSDDGVEYFPDTLTNPQQPVFSSLSTGIVSIGDVVRIYPGVRDKNSSPTANHGLEWWFVPLDAGKSSTVLRIQSGATNSFGYKAYVQKWDSSILSWVDASTTEVRVSDRNGGSYRTGQLIKSARFLDNDPVSGKDYYEGTGGLANRFGIGGIDLGDQILGTGYKMADALALWSFPGATSGGSGCFIGGDGYTYVLEDTTHYNTNPHYPFGSYNLNSFRARYIDAAADSSGFPKIMLSPPTVSGPYTVDHRDNGFSTVYTGVTKTIGSIGGFAAPGSNYNPILEFRGYDGSGYPVSGTVGNFVACFGGVFAQGFGIAGAGDIYYKGLNGGALGFSFAGGICIQVSSTYTIDGGTW